MINDFDNLFEELSSDLLVFDTKKIVDESTDESVKIMKRICQDQITVFRK